MHHDQFARGVEQFNSQYFFECHDTLEDMWMDTVGRDRLFLQGLIQVSVGFYHLFNRNFKGAVSQFTKGSTKLDGYRPVHHGVDVSRLLDDVAPWLDTARNGLLRENVTLDETGVPRIHYNPDSVKEIPQWQQ